MAYVVVDNFNRANETPVSGGGTWTSVGLLSGVTTGLNLVSNALERPGAGGGFGRAGSYYNAIQIPAGVDCQVAATLSQSAANSGGGGGELDLVLADLSKNGYYVGVQTTQWSGAGNEIVLTKIVASTATTLGLSGSPPASGDQYILAITGSVVSVQRIRAGVTTTLLSATDTTNRQAFYGGYEVAGSLDSPVMIVDDFGISAAYTKALADTITTSDSLSRTAAFNRALADTATMSDALSRTATFARSFSDTVTLTDALAKSLRVPFADSITMTDSLGKKVTLVKADSLTLTDAIAKALGLGKADSIGMTDAVAKSIGAALADTITLSDAATPAIGLPGVNYTLNLSDAITLTDALTRTLTNEGATPAQAEHARVVFLNRFNIVT